METGTENIALVVLSVFCYFILWIVINKALMRTPEKRDLWAVLVIVILAMPFNIGGNIWTMAGNARSEESVYSIFSVYQNAKKDAVSLVSVGYQNAGTMTTQIIGI